MKKKNLLAIVVMLIFSIFFASCDVIETDEDGGLEHETRKSRDEDADDEVELDNDINHNTNDDADYNSDDNINDDDKNYTEDIYEKTSGESIETVTVVGRAMSIDKTEIEVNLYGRALTENDVENMKKMEKL